jgi:alanine-synthesizing transaminase
LPDQIFILPPVRKQVVVVPGRGFGQPPGTAHFRVVFLPPEDALGGACRAIAELVRSAR